MNQGGSKGAQGKGAKFIESGGSDLSGNSGQIGGYSLGKNASLTVNNSGISPDLLTSLLGTMSTPAPNYSTSAPSPAPVTSQAPPATDATQTDTSTSGKTILGVSAGVALIIGLVAFLMFKKS